MPLRDEVIYQWVEFNNIWNERVPEVFFCLIYPIYIIPVFSSCFQCLYSYICLVFLTSLKLKLSLNKIPLYRTWNHCITSSLLPCHKTYITILSIQLHIQQIVLSFKYVQGAINKAYLVSHFRENTDMISSYAIHYMTTVVTSVVEVPQMLWDHVTFSSDLNQGRRNGRKSFQGSLLMVIAKINAWKALSLESPT